MEFLFSLQARLLALGLAACLGLFGCDAASNDGAATAEGPAASAEGDHDHDHADHGETGHAHGAWWCAEHGVPEEECAQCDKSLVAKFKAAGDWCDPHNRPDSQCFICHPENFDKFAARYEAKYGEKPEMPTE